MDELRITHLRLEYISGLSPVTVKVIAYCFCEWHCSSRIMSVLADRCAGWRVWWLLLSVAEETPWLQPGIQLAGEIQCFTIQAVDCSYWFAGVC